MSLETERFETAKREGTVTDKSGWHNPRDAGPFVRPRGCGCHRTTDKGAYRDVVVDMPDGRTIYFYHQSPVVVRGPDGRLRLSSCGYRTPTTKERINRHLPRGYYVRQEDFEWYLERPDGDREQFTDGVVVDP